MTSKEPEGKLAAIESLTESLAAVPVAERISTSTIRKLVDIAWRNQFEISGANRSVARREILTELAPEFQRAVERDKS
jgi:hypothetical protein